MRLFMGVTVLLFLCLSQAGLSARSQEPTEEVEIRCVSPEQIRLRWTEEHSIPGPKIYHLPTMSIKSDGVGGAELIPKSDRVDFKHFSLADAEKHWGAPREFFYQANLLNPWEFLRYGEKWEWFVRTPTAVYACFKMDRDGRTYRIETFFDHENPGQDVMQSKLRKYRVLVMGLGASPWIHVLESRDNDGSASNLPVVQNPATSGVSPQEIAWSAYRQVLGGDISGGLATYRQGTQIAPKQALDWVSQGICYQALGDLRHARSSYVQALQIDKNILPESAYVLALLDERLGATDDAAKLYREYLLTNPDGPHAEIAREKWEAMLRRRFSDHTGTGDQLKVLLSAEEAYRNALQLQGSSRKAQAVPLYEKAIRGCPFNTDFIYGLASCYADMGDLDKAIEQYRKMISLRPNNAKGESALKATVERKVQPLIDEAIQMQTDRTPDLFRAIQDYYAAFTASDDIAICSNLVAVCKRLDRGYLKAETACKRALEISESPQETAYCHYLLATVYEGEGRHHEASDQLMRARKLASGSFLELPPGYISKAAGHGIHHEVAP